MKIIQQLLIASCILTSQSTQPILWENVDYKTFYAYVQKATTILTHVHDQLQFELHGPREILYTGQGFADALYPCQKAALKLLRAELKALDSLNNNNAIPLNKMFKHEVYNQWKQNFKENYATSAQSNDIFAWNWLHKRMSFYIEE